MTRLSLALLLAGSALGLKTLVLPQEFADIYGAKCLDGTPPAVYMKANASSSTYVLFLEGGGWCMDTSAAGTVSSCFGRAAGGLGSSAGLRNGTDNVIGGLLSEDPLVNPQFHGANLIFAHYCDGASFSSFRPDPIPAPPGLALPKGAPTQIWMRGRANLRAVVEYLLQRVGMAAGSELIVSGGSAGATAVYLGLDYIREWVPPSLKVAGQPDAGYFLDETRAGTNQTWYRDCFIAAASVWNGSDLASPACMAAQAPSEQWRCYLPEYSTHYIATPTLISNSALDMWGLGNILALGCIPYMDNATHGQAPCPPAKWGLIQQWWDAFQLRLGPYLAASPASRSAFIPSCYVHEINVDYCSGQSLPNCRGWGKYLVAPSAGTPGSAPITLQAAVTQWYTALFGLEGAYERALAAGAAAVEAHVRRAAGGAAPEGVSGAAPGAVAQWVDAQRYPNNPSCYFPPGRI